MYAPNMLKGFRGVPIVAMVAWSLASCNSAARNAAVSVPNAEQEISPAMKKLYMAAAATAPQSQAQQKVVLQMAERASNGKELLLVMRAAVGTFPAGSRSQEHPAEGHLRSMVTAKMIQFGTLDQLMEYSTQYSVNPESARRFVQRMFQLGDQDSDPRVWYRIRLAAARLKVDDLQRQAQAKGDQLAGR